MGQVALLHTSYLMMDKKDKIMFYIAKAFSLHYINIESLELRDL